jgi:iron complex outermembrane receptor protein
VEFPDPDGDGPLASIAVTANVPEMEVEGIELDGSVMPTDWLELGLAYAYTDAEFTDGEVELFGNIFSYGPVANTPENSGTVWAQLIFPGNGLGEFRVRAELYAQDDMYFSNTYNSLGPRTKLDGYELVNARMDWNNILGSGFSAALFGRNLTDEDHFVGGMPLAAALGHNAAAVGEPRTYALELTYAF